MTVRDWSKAMRARGMKKFARTLVTLVVVAATVFASLPAEATLPRNVIVFLADDLGWNDLPYFSPPVDWDTIPGTTWADKKGEAEFFRPAANRLAARMYARETGGVGLFRKENLIDDYDVKAADWRFWSPPPAPTQYVKRGSVTPIPNDDCADTTIDATLPTCKDAEKDILVGFGGLQRLAKTGLIFPRFYTTSSKCGPTRASLMTGNYPPTAGLKLNHGHVKAADITIAEYLKQGCRSAQTPHVPPEKRCRELTADGLVPTDCPCIVADDVEDDTCPPTVDASHPELPCYRTGLIGKWHLGGQRGNRPYDQGFDEFFGFGGSSRYSWRVTDFQCSPTLRYCLSTTNQACTSDVQCPAPPGGGDAKCEARGLYLGTTRGAETDGINNSNDNRRTFNDCPDVQATKSKKDCCLPKGTGGRDEGPYLASPHLTGTAEPLGQDNRKDGLRPCSNMGLTKDVPCAYSTRVYRDQARNFIIRNAHLEPFFLVVTFNATHGKFAAPASTEDHYRTKIEGNMVTPKNPNEKPVEYWGMLEELDAGIGEILALLDKTQVCAADPSKACSEGCPAGTGCINLGRDTSDSNVCGSGSGCDPLSKRTVVFFTADQGRPAAGYGNPDLRGGKGDVFDGGIRVGMLAHHPDQKRGVCWSSTEGPTRACDPDVPGQCGLGTCIDGPGICRDGATTPTQCDPEAETTGCANPQQEPCDPLEVHTPVLASMVDLYPTVAEIAGIGPYLIDGQAPLASGANPPRTQGRSFLWALTNPDPTTGRPTKARERAYASYPGAGITVVTEEHDAVNLRDPQTQLPPYRVCIYDSKVDNPTAQRRIIAGSCESTPCTPADNKWCKLPGRVCVLQSDLTTGGTPAPRLESFSFSPTNPQKALLRCTNDASCPNGLECTPDVWIKCNAEQRDTLWKYRPTGSGQNADAGDLFELRSNPGEEAELDCRFSPVNAGNAISNALFNTPDNPNNPDTYDDLQNWKNCTSNPPTNCVQPAP